MEQIPAISQLRCDENKLDEMKKGETMNRRNVWSVFVFILLLVFGPCFLS
jgi:hypothetical protein